MKLKSYRDLTAWQMAMDLVVSVYEMTREFPENERYGLTNQLRRAAVSIPSNVAEGQGRSTSRDFLHFLSVAYGSLQEVETQLILAQRLGFASEQKIDSILAQCGEVGRLTNGLRRSLRKSAPTDHRQPTTDH
jgi:four helix bundle protein